jgi:hypothetical protein
MGHEIKYVELVKRHYFIKFCGLNIIHLLTWSVFNELYGKLDMTCLQLNGFIPVTSILCCMPTVDVVQRFFS